MLKKTAAKAKAILLWSQKYTKTDMLYLAKGGFWLGFGQVATSGLVLVITIVFANALPKESYGAYKYVMSIAGILLITTLPQMSTAVTQAVARGYEGTLLRSLKPKLLWGSLGVLAGLGAAAYYALNGNQPLAAAFLFVAIFLPFFAASSLYDAFLIGRKLFHVSVVYSTLLQTASTAALIAAAMLTKDVTSLIIIYFGTRTIVNAALFSRTLKKFKPNDQDDAGAVTYGKHMTLMNAINTVANSLDSVLVYHFLGGVQLAIYAIAVGPPDQLKGLLANLDTLVFPNFSNRDSREIRANMKSKFLNLFILSVLVVAAYVLAAPFMYRLVFPKYQEAVLYSQLFSLGMLNMAFFPAATYLRAKRKLKELYAANIMSSIFQIVVMIVGVVMWGLLGLVIARILSRYVGMLINVLFYHQTRFDSDESSPPLAAEG